MKEIKDKSLEVVVMDFAKVLGELLVFFVIVDLDVFIVSCFLPWGCRVRKVCL